MVFDVPVNVSVHMNPASGSMYVFTMNLNPQQSERGNRTGLPIPACN